MPLPLEGKVALVTGSSRGIGKATALELAREGADLIVAARSLESTEYLPGSISQTAAEVRSLGRRALAVKLDVSNDDDLHNVVEETLREFGRIDILVNNAAYMASAPILETTVEGLESAFSANVRAPYVLTQLVAPAMIKQGGGVIVNISSGAARNLPPPAEQRNPRHQPGPEYGVTKAALDRLTTGIAEDLGEHNIAIVSVWPPFTLTERLMKRPHPTVDMSTAKSLDIPAKAIAFVCKDPMRYNGHVLVAVDLVEQNGLL